MERGKYGIMDSMNEVDVSVRIQGIQSNILRTIEHAYAAIGFAKNHNTPQQVGRLLDKAPKQAIQ